MIFLQGGPKFEVTPLKITVLNLDPLLKKCFDPARLRYLPLIFEVRCGRFGGFGGPSPNIFGSGAVRCGVSSDPS